MKLYSISGHKCRFNTGTRIGLTVEQAAPRAAALRSVPEKSGFRDRKTFEVVVAVEFKKGEIIALDGAVNKRILHDLSPSGDEKKENRSGENKEQEQAAPKDGALESMSFAALREMAAARAEQIGETIPGNLKKSDLIDWLSSHPETAADPVPAEGDGEAEDSGDESDPDDQEEDEEGGKEPEDQVSTGV